MHWLDMSDHLALVVTAYATGLGALGTVLAVAVALGLALREGRRDRESREDAERLRREDEDARRRGERRSLYLRLVLEIAQDYETSSRVSRRHMGFPSDTEVEEQLIGMAASNRLRANLSALPLAYLGTLRWVYKVMPDARDEGRVESYGEHKPEKIRDEIRALLYNLSGEGTDQDYEPPGSPTANRPRRPPEYP